MSIYVVIRVLYLLVAAAGLVGAIMVASTREDAFDAADRKPKWIWAGLLLGSALAVGAGIPFISWIGLVVIGVYWWDVRPQIKDLLGGGSGFN